MWWSCILTRAPDNDMLPEGSTLKLNVRAGPAVGSPALSAAACASGAQGGTAALDGVQRGASGSLHLTRSPRHGMHSSARHGALWDA